MNVSLILGRTGYKPVKLCYDIVRKQVCLNTGGLGKAWLSMMEQRNQKRSSRYNSRVLLLAVLVGFCILALIEIIYGQRQIKLEKERIALEQDNQQKMQELQERWDALDTASQESADEAQTDQTASANKTSEPDVDTSKFTNSEPQQSTESAEQEQPVGTSTVKKGETATMDEKQYDMQIVFMGDSILDNDRENGGVASLVSDGCNARVYNMAIGGTTAALTTYQKYDFNDWQSSGLLGIVNGILGNIPPSYFEGKQAEWILEECDFSKTDYFVIEYGINDFLSGQIPQSRYLADGSTLAVDDVHTYSGALSTAVTLLQNNFPNAKILLIAPHYCQIFSGNTFIGDGYSVNYGYGALVEFARCAGYVYEQNKDKNVLFFNAFEESGINAETADKYLLDGIHLNPEGRRIYADYVIRLIKADFYPEE